MEVRHTGLQLGVIDVAVLCRILIIALIATAGVKWIPLVKFGSISVEIHNAVSLSSCLIAFGIIFLRKRIVLPKEFLLYFLVVLLIIVTSVYRGNNIPGTIIVSVPAVLGALVIVQHEKVQFIGEKYKYGFIFLLISLFISAKLSGQDLFVGLINYFTTYNRDIFLYQTLRPIFNAFSPSSEEIAYGGPLVNHLSSGFYLFFVIASANLVKGEKKAIDWLIASFSLLMIFALFSSTVLGVAIVTLGLALFFSARQIKSHFSLIVSVAIFIIVIPVTLPYVLNFLIDGLLGDAHSATTRMSQNSVALDLINHSVLTGGGTATHGNHGLHNMPLYAWTEGGIIGFIAVLYLYGLCILSFVNGFLYLIKNQIEYRFEAFLLTSLPLFFIVRTFFGGGGGMPATAEATALGLIVVARIAVGNQLSTKKVKLF
jgi:uncharacterized protein (UPF0333 family)